MGSRGDTDQCASFKVTVAIALRRCFDELRNHLLARSRRSRTLPTNARRHRFLTPGIVALRILEAA